MVANGKPKEPEPEPEESVDEWGDVEARLLAFDKLGFSPAVAFVLAMHPDISVSKVREMLRNGCDRKTAALIVL